MRRRLLLLGGLTCAVALAVLLRTTASDLEPIVAAPQGDTAVSVVSDFTLEDCAISPDSAPGLVSSEAAQLYPAAPPDAAEIGVAPIADERGVALLATLDAGPTTSLIPSFHDSIRAPPETHIA